MQAMIEAAPQLIDFLGEASLAHLERCARCSTPPAWRTASIRGWCAAWTTTTCTVFEWVTDRLGSQGTVCGGGRYDGLFEQLGGQPTPAVGWGMGIERMLLLLEDVGVPMPAGAPDVYAVVPGPRPCRARSPPRGVARRRYLGRCMPEAATAGAA